MASSYTGIIINDKSITIQKAQMNGAGNIVLDSNSVPITESVTVSREKAVINTSGIDFSADEAEKATITFSFIGNNAYFQITKNLLDDEKIFVTILSSPYTNINDIWLFVRDSF